MREKCRCSAAAVCSMTVILVAGPAWAQTAIGSASAPGVSTASAFPQQGAFFTRLFRATVTDFRQVPSKENLFIIGIGGLAAGVARPADTSVSSTLSRSASMGSAFAPGERIGSAASQMAAAIATQMVGNAVRNERVAALGSDLVRAQIVTQMMTAGIKLSVRRTRPDGTMYSFPSGHASTTFATATVLQRHFGWKAGAPAYALATYVAASRVQVKRHFLSDVTMGAAVGIVAGRSVTVGRGDARFALAPAAVPGGAAVQFNWLGRR